jgi:hypothetical protein
VGSSDAIQVKVDGQEKYIDSSAVQKNIVIGTLSSGNIANKETCLIATLGLHRILIKAFKFNGEHTFRFRFKNETDGIEYPTIIGCTKKFSETTGTTGKQNISITNNYINCV